MCMSIPLVSWGNKKHFSGSKGLTSPWERNHSEAAHSGRASKKHIQKCSLKGGGLSVSKGFWEAEVIQGVWSQWVVDPDGAKLAWTKLPSHFKREATPTKGVDVLRAEPENLWDTAGRICPKNRFSLFLLAARKSWKIPNPTNAWGHFCTKIWKIPNHQKRHGKNMRLQLFSCIVPPGQKSILKSEKRESYSASKELRMETDPQWLMTGFIPC